MGSLPTLHMRYWMILMTLFFGVMAADSPIRKRTYSDIIKFPLFSIDKYFLNGVPFTKIRLGNPYQKFNVLVDTGSEQVWVNCPSTDDLIARKSYDMKRSNTSTFASCSHKRNRPCPFNVEYVDMNYASGYYINDSINLGTLFSRSPRLSKAIVFGCATKRSMSLKHQIEGILGLGQGKQSLVAQLSSHGVAPPVFTLCLASRGDGFLILGEVLEKSLEYTPILSKTTYQVEIESIVVNGDPLPIKPRVFRPKHGTTVNTGEQISLIVAEVYDSLLNAVSKSLNQTPYFGGFGFHCYKSSTRNEYPTLRFQFRGGASLSLAPSYYLSEDIFYRETGYHGYCFRFKRGRDVTVLGGPLFLDKLVTYNLVHRQIGWAENINCSESFNASLVYDVNTASVVKSFSIKTMGISIMAATVLALSLR